MSDIATLDQRIRARAHEELDRRIKHAREAFEKAVISSDYRAYHAETTMTFASGTKATVQRALDAICASIFDASSSASVTMRCSLSSTAPTGCSASSMSCARK